MESQAVVRTVQKKRTTNFREDETKLLIQLWGSPQIQNKLYLTHRKAPVMRLLAATMQQRGFYRTPDEIKTRIRNLKCLYHRIKRTMACGTGIGTVDPDWPHFKAMDAILNKQQPQMKRERIEENIFEGPRCEDIKQEVDIDINDDVESWATTSMGSEAEEDPIPPPLTPAPSTKPPQARKPPEKPIQSKPMPTIVPSFAFPTVQQQNQSNATGARPGTMPSIPVPLLILNSLQPQQTQVNNTQEKKDGVSSSNGNITSQNGKDLHNLLGELVEVQKENLEIEKQRLDIEKQRLELSRLVGSQLVTLVPMVGTLVQRLSFTTGQTILDLAANSLADCEVKKGKKRKLASDLDILKDSKILRTVLEQGIKKYMMGEDNEEKTEDDCGLQHDENSSSNESDK